MKNGTSNRKCPICKSPSSVIDSRESKQGFRRRRKCLKCNFRWTTFEVREKLWKAVVKMLKTLYGNDIFKEIQ